MKNLQTKLYIGKITLIKIPTDVVRPLRLLRMQPHMEEMASILWESLRAIL